MFWHASVLPSIHLSVHRGGYPYPIMLCNISQNAMRQPGGVPRSGYPPGGGTEVRVPPRGVPRSGYPPRGVPRSRYPPWGGYWGPGTPPPGGYQGPGTPPGGGYQGPGTHPPPPGGGYRGPGTPPGGGGTRVGQQKEYSLHGGRYASCVHAGGLTCLIMLLSAKLRS